MKTKLLAIVACLSLFVVIPVFASPANEPPAPWTAPPPLVLEPNWIEESTSAGADSAAVAAAGGNRVFIPLLTALNTGGGGDNRVSGDAQTAIRLVNEFRSIAGVDPLKLDNTIVKASENHARYHMLNASDPGAWVYGAHGEVERKPGYTGQWPSDRLENLGFPWIGGAEVIHYYGDPETAVRDWMNTVYHRILLLDPAAEFAGYAGDQSSQTAIDVMDFGIGPDSRQKKQPAPYPLAYPASGQKNVPVSWSGLEAPDPLPAGAKKPVGFPFTLQGVGGTLVVDQIELVDSSGKPVPVHPNPPDCPTFNCYAVIAVSPLKPGTTYRVHARGNVGGVPFDQKWEFRTAR